MKHIFHIQSNINLVIAIAVIDLKKIKKEDVILSVCRNIDVSYLPFRKIEIDDNIYYHSYNRLRNLHDFKWRYNTKIIDKIDFLIKNAIHSNSFIFYCPNSRNFLHRVFITNKSCVGVEYIEDGMDAYLSEKLYYKKYPYQLRWKQLMFQETIIKFFNVFCYKRLRQLKDPFKTFYNHEAIIYCISQKAFSYRNEVQVLSLKRISNLFDSNITIAKDNDNILILDAVVEQKVLTLELYEKLILFISSNLNCRSLKIKFHPYQDGNLKKWTMDTFKSNIDDVVEYNDDIPFELVLAIKSNMAIHGIGSSLLLYSSFIGNHKTHIYYPLLKELFNFTSPRLPYWESAFENILCTTS